MEWAEIYRRIMRDREDAEAFAALKQRVSRWARRDLWSQGSHVVEDATADTCYLAVMRIRNAHGENTFCGFVYGHYMNVRGFYIQPPRPGPPGPRPPGPDPEPRVDYLVACMKKLRERARRAIEMRFFDDVPYAQIACELNVGNENAARQIVFNAKTKLRQCIEKQMEAEKFQERGHPGPPPEPPIN